MTKDNETVQRGKGGLVNKAKLSGCSLLHFFFFLFVFDIFIYTENDKLKA